MVEAAGDWCTIESDPGVFTLLIEKFGVQGVQVEEIWSMDDSMFNDLRPVHGLIFLFKYIQNEAHTGSIVTNPDLLDKVYFSKQVIVNACATQAVINLLCNVNHPDLTLGAELTQLKEFSRSFDPWMRGLTISNSNVIRLAHNSMAQQHIFEESGPSKSSDEDAFHYVAYLPVAGRLLELDGLCEGPIDHGPISPHQDWLDVMRPVLEARISRYREGEIRFNLLAVVSNRKMIYQRRMKDAIVAAEPDEVSRLRMLIEIEDNKMARYRSEHARRRHNYVPFMMSLLQLLARERRLTPLYERHRRAPLKRLQT